MPRHDGTGPMGMGPRTGKGFGPCCGYGCFRCPRSKSISDQKQMLTEYLQSLQEEAEEVKKELAEMEKNS